MMNYPTTVEEAKAYRYNCWGGNPSGTNYREGKCAAEVYSVHLFYQCSNRAKCGPGNLYCGRHAKDAERDLRLSQSVDADTASP